MNCTVYKNKTLVYAIVFALIFCIVFFAMQDLAHVAFANSDTLNFDDTNVLDDLESSTVNGQPFDILSYVFDDNKELQIINFVEYCYSPIANRRSNYAIYIYLYNPKGLELVENSEQNKIQMAVSWVKNSKGEYVADRYEKFNLKFCNKSEKENYEGLFYKFKVIDKDVNEKSMAERVNPAARRYDVSGVELLTSNHQNATEYGVGGSYCFTGYAQGYGDSDESTLSCSVKRLETIELELQSTAYRTDRVSSAGKDHYNQVNTVYFSIPDYYYKEFGFVQKIRAEWWEYKTKMAAITSNQSFYEQMMKYIYRDVGEYNSLVPVYLYSGYEGRAASYLGGANIHNYEWCYNCDTSTKKNKLGMTTDIYYWNNKSTILPYVFYSEALDSESIFDFLYTKSIAGDVDSSVVKDWIYNYEGNKTGGIKINGRRFSQKLFESFVDDGRTMGYNDKTIDLGDTFNLMSYNSNHSWWDKFWDYGFSAWPSTGGDYENISPIYELQSKDLIGSANDIADTLLVNESDVASLQTYYAKESLLGNHVMLFRFANTDYYSAPAFTSAMPAGTALADTDTYVAQQTLFFDFDIIELTFNKDGEYTVIPAVSSPIDIINGFSAPPRTFDWWKIIVMLLALILVIVLLAPILPYILQAIIWLIKLPFKIIGRIGKSFKKYSDKRKNKSSGVTKDDIDNKAKSQKTKRLKRGKKQKKKE